MQELVHMFRQKIADLFLPPAFVTGELSAHCLSETAAFLVLRSLKVGFHGSHKKYHICFNEKNNIEEMIL